MAQDARWVALLPFPPHLLRAPTLILSSLTFPLPKLHTVQVSLSPGICVCLSLSAYHRVSLSWYLTPGTPYLSL